MLGEDYLQRVRARHLTAGILVQHLRGAAAPMVAKAAGYDWIFIDTEHSALSVQDVSQISLAALGMGIAPFVRVCADSLDEGTRALDNGALGVIVPHVDTATQAKAVVDRFRFPPVGHRSWGGFHAQFGFRPPPAMQAQATLNGALLITVMIETPLALENVFEIAAVPGIDVLMIGASDLSMELGVPGEIGHEKIQAAYSKAASACRQHGKVLGLGGVYDEQWTRRYVEAGATFILAGSDHAILLNALTKRAEFCRSLGTSAGETKI